jgi:hypothetical protein
MKATIDEKKTRRMSLDISTFPRALITVSGCSDWYMRGTAKIRNGTVTTATSA